MFECGVGVKPTLSVVRRQIPVNFSQFFYLLFVFFSACMFFLLIGIETITGDRLCFSYQFLAEGVV